MRVFAAATFISAVSANNVAIYHRVFHPALPAQPYLARGSLAISSNPPTLVPSPDIAEHLVSFSETLESIQDSAEALYQVALEREGDTSALWDISSVKVCHLSLASSETILLHLSGDPDPKPFALDYYISPIPHHGSCPQTISKKKIHPATPVMNLSKTAQHLNTTIILRRTESPPLPELREPPPLTPKGEVVIPQPEKGFLQKYWMYIGALALILLVGSGPEDERPKRGGGGE
ncbi:hypothetical protein M413DRAFT_441117 [Hebeloma cylindrosporum]|uniref:ER membrane protein complex subunit 10 n=1 Tax=Hebeloma cylindrosporum TaxID=76867 RepID=A0A0C2YYJ9_HEBCY|nr:hypothetical protein M413DRAFT_441117 [Hebeloma cylindrosporum h7]